MFITFQKFTDNRAAAPEFMAAHDDWIARGFRDGAFFAVGSLASAAGGAILGHGESRAAYEAKIAADPFVIQGIVTAETHEIDLKRRIPELDFLEAPA